MEIKTKFNLRQEVFFVDGEKGIITKGKIEYIIISTTEDIRYGNNWWMMYKEKNIFEIKEDAEKRSEEIIKGK